MKALADIESRIGALAGAGDTALAAGELLALGEQVLEHWVRAAGGTPTRRTREGFRLLALHRQGARGAPAFNACRETCRELVYHYNLITMQPDHPETPQRLRLAAMVALHLYLFVSGKMEVAGLGEFCCSSRPLRAQMS
ncbi:MAG: hypothetical protein V3U44_01550 [Alphaproteobacteria bacterium]